MYKQTPVFLILPSKDNFKRRRSVPYPTYSTLPTLLPCCQAKTMCDWLMAHVYLLPHSRCVYCKRLCMSAMWQKGLCICMRAV